MTAHITIFSAAAVWATLAFPASSALGQVRMSPHERDDARALLLEQFDSQGPSIDEVILALDCKLVDTFSANVALLAVESQMSNAFAHSGIYGDPAVPDIEKFVKARIVTARRSPPPCDSLKPADRARMRHFVSGLGSSLQ